MTDLATPFGFPSIAHVLATPRKYQIRSNAEMLIRRELDMSTSKYVGQVERAPQIFRVYGRDITIYTEACLWPIDQQLSSWTIH
jgi:hypothetical protein